MQRNNIYVPVNEFLIDPIGYADLPDDENPIFCDAEINKLSVLSFKTDSKMVDLQTTWLIPNLREFCTKRKEGNFPAIEKFRICSKIDFNKIFYVDLLLKPKIVANTIAMDYLQFSAQIKSLEPLNYFAHFGVSILTRLGEEMWSTSSTQGAAFSDSRSFRTQLVPISCLFNADKSESSNLLIDGDLHLSIDLKVRTRPIPIDPILSREMWVLLIDPTFGDLKIEARYRSFYVHRRILAKHPQFVDIYWLHPYEQEINLTNWNQDQLIELIHSLYLAEGFGSLAEIDR